MSLLTRWVPLAELEAKGFALARERACRQSPTASAASRRLSMPKPTAWRACRKLAVSHPSLFYRTAEAQEGRDAFSAKKDPNFSDKPGCLRQRQRVDIPRRPGLINLEGPYGFYCFLCWPPGSPPCSPAVSWFVDGFLRSLPAD